LRTSGEFPGFFRELVYQADSTSRRFYIDYERYFFDHGKKDPVSPTAYQHSVQDLPSETLMYLVGSRYCDTDLLSEEAWRLFEGNAAGWDRVQAICDYVHQHVVFGYEHAQSTRTASQTLAEGHGVCRDFHPTLRSVSAAA
jgi:transglutaminase-like putative cysteine protease